MRDAAQDGFDLPGADIGVQPVQWCFAVQQGRGPSQPRVCGAGVGEGGFRLLDDPEQPAEAVGLIGRQEAQTAPMRQCLAGQSQPVEFGQGYPPFVQGSVHDSEGQAFPDIRQPCCRCFSEPAWCWCVGEVGGVWRYPGHEGAYRLFADESQDCSSCRPTHGGPAASAPMRVPLGSRPSATSTAITTATMPTTTASAIP